MRETGNALDAHADEVPRSALLETAAPVSAYSSAPKPRDPRIDAMRWGAMIVVIIGHALLTRPASDSIGTIGVAAILSFNMPLFAFLTGLVTRRVDILKRFAQLMVPYVVWLALYYFLLPGESAEPTFLGHMADGILSPTGAAKPWFPYALFMCLVLFWATERIPRVRVLVAAGMLLFTPGMALLGIDRVFWLFPYLVGGWLVGSASSLERLRPLPALFIGVAVWSAAVWLDLRYGALWSAVLQQDSGVGGLVESLDTRLVARGVALAAASSGILWFVALYRLGRRFRFQSYLGQHTLGMFFTQTPIWHFGPLSESGSTPLVFAVTLAGSAIASVLLSKTPLAGPLVGLWNRSALPGSAGGSRGSGAR